MSRAVEGQLHKELEEGFMYVTRTGGIFIFGKHARIYHVIRAMKIPSSSLKCLIHFDVFTMCFRLPFFVCSGLGIVTSWHIYLDT